LARNPELPKLTFQVIRRTIATLAQKKGTVKDVQGVLRHSRTATTTDVDSGERAGDGQRDQFGVAEIGRCGQAQRRRRTLTKKARAEVRSTHMEAVRRFGCGQREFDTN
jgi:hypothetical protein